VCGRNLITGLTSAASPRVAISSTCKVGQKLGLSHPLLTCSPSAWPSRLLYSSGRKFRRDLWITLYIITIFIFITEIRKTSGKLLRKVVNNLLIIKLCIIHMHYPVTNVLD
jgi:hypothetical protein